MGKIKNALKPLGDLPILEHFLYFKPDENDFEAHLEKAPYLSEPKGKPEEKNADTEEPLRFTGGIPVEASENDELWKIAAR